MIEEKILAIGAFGPENLHISLTESNRAIKQDIELQIDTLWEEIQRQALAEGRICYNGTSYRLNSLNEEGSELFIELGLLEFKARTTLPKIDGYFELPVMYYRKGCYCGATVRTSDNHYLVVETSGKSMNYNAFELLGGIIEKPQEMHTGTDIFESQFLELEEEACIQKHDIANCTLRAVYLDTTTNIGFYFEVELKISAKDILERFTLENQDQDIQALKALTLDEYETFLRNHSSSKRFIATVRQI